MIQFYIMIAITNYYEQCNSNINININNNKITIIIKQTTSMSDTAGNDSSLRFKYQNYDDDFQEQPSHTKDPTKLKHKNKNRIKNTEDLTDNYQDDFVPQTREYVSKQPKRESEMGAYGRLEHIVVGSGGMGMGTGGGDREKLIEHNIKLKTQIYELTKQMDDILMKDKVKRKREITEQDDQSLRARKLELKKQQLEIQELKNKITLVKRQLENVYDNRTIIAKEDNLKLLKNELRALEDQKSALMKIKKEQNKALKSMKNQNEYQSKIIELKGQLARVKEESKDLNQKLVENERILRRNHEQYIIKQNKIKEMEQKMAQNKQKEKNKKVQSVISPQMIEELEEEINSLEKQKKQVERHWQQKISMIDQELHQKRQEQQRKLLILKEKEKELKLNEMKIKELKRLVKHNGSDIRRKTEEPSDPKEFRHKRNIKYLDSNR